MLDVTKSETQSLRRLAEAAWDCELREVLEELNGAFGQWKRGEISSFQLSDRIHEFHDGDARDLYKVYTGGHPSQTVAHALAHGHIPASAVPEGILDKLAPAVAFLSEELKRTH